MSIDPPTLRDRAEHAAKYGANLVVPAREIKQLLDERDQAQALADAVQAVREEHVPEPGQGTAYCCDCEQVMPCQTLRTLDRAALAEVGDER